MTHLLSILIGFHECQNAMSVHEITELTVSVLDFNKYSFCTLVLVLWTCLHLGMLH